MNESRTHGVRPLSCSLWLLALGGSLAFGVQSPLPGDPLQPLHPPGRALVRFEPGVVSSASSPSPDRPAVRSAAVRTLLAAPGASVRTLLPAPAPRALKGLGTATRGGLDDWYIVETGDRTDPAALCRALLATGDVRVAEPDVYCSPAETIPDDPFFATSGTWGQNYEDLWGLHRCGFAQAWDVTTGATDVVVAVIDTGLQLDHPDLAGNVWTNPGEIPGNGLDDDGNGYVDDVHGWDFVYFDNEPDDAHGHGTHVSGTIAAVANNGTGVVGCSWRSRIMPVKGLDVGGGLLSDLVACIVYAAENGARVCNNSWGPNSISAAPQALVEAVAYAASLDCLVVAAAGNSQKDVGSAAMGFFPASLPEAVAVSAIDATGELASFSNFGRKVSVAAPGVDVLSCLAAGSAFALDPAAQGSIVAGDYIRLNGTSMASPHAAGLAALLFAARPGLPWQQARLTLELSAADLGPAGQDPSYGWGRIDAARALALVPSTEIAIVAPPLDTVFPSGSVVSLVGDTAADGFERATLEVTTALEFASAAPAWETIATSIVPVTSGPLGDWRTQGFAEDAYVLRLTVERNGGGTEMTYHRLRVDNSYLSSPAHGSPIRGAVPLVGSATGEGMQSYKVTFSGRFYSGTAAQGTQPVQDDPGNPADGLLGTWNTIGRRDDTLDLALEVSYAGGRSGTDAIQVTLDNLHTALDQPGNYTFHQGTVDVIGSANSNQSGFLWDLAEYPGTTEFYYDQQYGGYDSPFRRVLASGTAGITDGLLAQWDTAVTGDGWATLQLYADDAVNNGEMQIAYVFKQNSPAQAGWPGYAGGRGVFGSPLAADLDGDGELEVLAGVRTFTDLSNFFDPKFGSGIVAFNADRTPLAGWEDMHAIGYTGQLALPAVGDVNGDGRLEVVGHGSGRVFVWQADGTPLSGWEGGTPFGASNDQRPMYGVQCPVLADLDGDGADEIVIVQERVHVFKGNGSRLPNWNKAVIPAGWSTQHCVPAAVGDLDRDGAPEVVVVHFSGAAGSWATKVWAWNADGTPCAGAWPATLSTSNVASPSCPLLVDFEGDGYLEILVCANPAVYEIDQLGNVYERFRSSASYAKIPVDEGVAVGDVDGDGVLEIAVHYATVAPLGAFEAVELVRRDGTKRWVQQWLHCYGSNGAPIFADVTGDGLPEVLCGETDRLWAWDAAGNVVPGWPKTTANGFTTSPLAADLDRDGDLELVYGSLDAWLYAWDLDIPYSETAADYPMARVDARRSGNYVPGPVRDQYTPTPTPTRSPTATLTPTPPVPSLISVY